MHGTRIAKRMMWGYVRYWHLADIPSAPSFVHYWSNSGQVRASALTANVRSWLIALPRQAKNGRSVCETVRIRDADGVAKVTPAKAFKTATSENAFILGMSGPRNPYPGKLSVIQKRAHADMCWSRETPLKTCRWSLAPTLTFGSS